ncbi:GNAT family N-acetyltransferase [uncultured Aquimarina sp.]|uniref:GNAT family N-acetyltransferase n=1 Tax=uncultured Aquimarina sp. TaxID=575652 RepID=UPI00262460B2|nr:GNAT family N-acetyltransferase [uncultured Aquimarina sp.]
MESKELKIIKILPEDNHKLLEIGLQTFYNSFGPPHNSEQNIQSYLNKNFTLEKITNEILHPESQFFFVICNNQIIGYIKFNSGVAQTEIVQGKSLEIERIYIIKSYQGQGIGQYLFDYAKQMANEKALEFIWLGVWDKNTRAIQFYERNGFKIFDKHTFMLGSEKQTDVMMKCFL